MPLFEITSPDQSFASLQVIAPDPSAVLHVVQRHDLKEADVQRDGAYIYSVRLGDNGLWCIFQREEQLAEEEIPTFG